MARLELFQPSGSLERSHSCSGRIEASLPDNQSYDRTPSSRRKDIPHPQRINSKAKQVLSRSSIVSGSQGVADSLHLEVSNTGLKAEKNDYYPDQNIDTSIQVKEINDVAKGNQDDEREILISLQVPRNRAKDGRGPQSSSCLIIRKRHFGDEDEDVLVLQRFKKPRGRIKRTPSTSEAPSK